MFLYNGRNKQVKEAVSNANLLMQNHSNFIGRIGVGAGQEYTMTEVDPGDIASFMKDRYMNSIQRVRCRYTWNPFSKALAWFKPSLPNTITLHTRRLKRYKNKKQNIDSLTGSIMHEYVHLVDNFYKYARFGHGDNRSYKAFDEESEMWTQKYYSAPYRIGGIAKGFCEKTIG